MIDLPLIPQLALIFLIALVGGSLAALVKQPPFIGYILFGLIFGPRFLGLIQTNEQVDQISQIGVVLLLFSIGLEFSIEKLIKYGRVAVVGGVIQVAGCVVAGLVFITLGFDLLASLFLGALTAISSTAIVVKVLQMQHKLTNTEGRIIISYLLIQDLMVLPLMLIFPFLKEGNLFGLVGSLVKTGLLVGLIFFFGVNILPKVIDKLVKKNRDLFIILIFFLAISIAYLTGLVGLSTGIGAFLAGLIVSMTPTAYQAFADMRSLKEIFIVIFFVSIGLLIDPFAAIQNPLFVIIVLVVSVLAKFIFTSFWILKFGYSAKVAFITSLSLLSIGEFSFILGKIGVEHGIINPSVYSSIMTVSLVTIILTGPTIAYSTTVYNFLRGRVEKMFPSLANWIFAPRTLFLDELKETEGHVVVCGLGHVGKYISQALLHWRIPQVVVDFDLAALEYAEDKGIPAIYGEASDENIFKYLHLDQAKALVIAHADYESAHYLIKKAKKANPDLLIMARADHNQAYDRLSRLKIERIVQPKFEASLKFTEKLLSHLGIDEKEADSFLKHIRYQPN